jgi:hypothetical protein
VTIRLRLGEVKRAPAPVVQAAEACRNPRTEDNVQIGRFDGGSTSLLSSVGDVHADSFPEIGDHDLLFIDGDHA